MRDHHYLRLRTGRSRHPLRAKNGKTEKGHITALRNDLPGIVAHTAAGGPKRARSSVTSTGLDLRTRIPLARFAACCVAPPHEKTVQQNNSVGPGKGRARQTT